jgi:hypothetical protein
MSITDAELLALKPKTTPYKVFIGKGTYILVNPNGTKYWRLRYWLEGTEKVFALGVFPRVSIDAAKAARDSARALILKGINPTAAKREARAKSIVPEPVFRLGLSINGALTIETDRNALTLTLAQTQALRAFLGVTNDNKKDSS